MWLELWDIFHGEWSLMSLVISYILQNGTLKLKLNTSFIGLEWIRAWDCGPKQNEVCIVQHQTKKHKKLVQKSWPGKIYFEDQIAHELFAHSILPENEHVVSPKYVCYETANDDQQLYLKSLCFEKWTMDLNRALPWTHKRNISFRTMISIFKQIVLGLHHLHQHSIVHRDLCPDNILVSDEMFGQVAICDLGSATHLTHDHVKNEELCHSGFHVEDEFLTTKYDIYALGRIGNTIFFNNWDYSKMPKILPKDDATLFTLYGIPPSSIRMLLELCVSKNHNERLSAEMILKFILVI